MTDNLNLPDLVRDWELNTTIISDTCPVHASHIADSSKGMLRQSVEEKWERKERLGSGSFGVVWRHECVSGPQIGKPLPEDQTRLISLQVLQGLAFMHRSNVAHWDMKPHNILVQNKGPQWRVEIADFGCSKNTEETLLRTHRVGTPAYLAPEMHPYLLSREGGGDDDGDDDEDDTYIIASVKLKEFLLRVNSHARSIQVTASQQGTSPRTTSLA
ncbi:kinase-like domain-containing protein [Dactylonectria macrodidyma]|uniref:Kinase-like domain-containing protein n=1 Tax=Dactylonectria macrodidyma TaxID=307937 RepID=A0A9P9DYX2_9HYPO|nr:kinase-like domain-containing protein [Dactylonectria macrodidyma]